MCRGNVITCLKVGPELNASTCTRLAEAVLFSLAAALDRACPELCGLMYIICIFL